MHNLKKENSFLIKYFIKIILIGFLIISQISAQQSGKISGKVVDAQNGEALIGANILVEGTNFGAAADIDGNFIINSIPVGKHTVIFSMIGYAKSSVTNVEVKPGEVTKIDIALNSESFQTDEVVITAKALENNDAGLLIKRQKSNSVSDAISAEAISRSGSSDAAAAVKKVVGASVVDGKYVYIRGLGDRYSSTQLNGAELPSSDPNKKAFQLDLIPSNLLDNIVTIKTFTPDKPGNFSGGIVDIGTKTFPSSFNMKISASSSYNSQVDGSSAFLSYDGGSKDWLGYDDGTRSIPSLLENSELDIPIPVQARFDSEKAEQLDAYSKSFNGVMDFKREVPAMNGNFSMSLGDNFKFGDVSSLGYLASLTYSRENSFYNDGKIGRYILTDLNSNELNPQLLMNDSKATSEANWGALFTTNFNINSFHQIGGNVFYSRSGITTTRFQQGRWPQEFGIDDTTSTFYNRVLGFRERDLLTYQVRGEHNLDWLLDTKADWNASFSETSQNEPDLRLIASFERLINDDTSYTISGGNFDDPSRYFRTLNDKSSSFNLNFAVPVNFGSYFAGKFKFGGAYQKMERDFNERIFSYATDNRVYNNLDGDITKFFSSENNGIIEIDTLSNGRIRYNFGNTIRDNSKLRNVYNGTQEISAAYLMLELPLLRNLKFIGGARYETTSMNVVSKDETIAPGSIKENDILPSLNLIYQLSDDMNIRFAATQTLARPNFREIAPYSSKEFVNDVELQGNPSLKRTLIDNYDLRWEWYSRPGEIIAVSAFYKNMKNPIELAYAPGSSLSNQIVTYQNVDAARIIGAEFEVRLGLDLLLDELSNFSFGSNLSLVDSKIDIPDFERQQRLAIDSSSSSTRELQGQSNVILNMDLSYYNEIGTTASLQLNTFSERLSKVSAGVSPDVYEQPDIQLDFILSQQIWNNFTFSFSAKNILNSSYKEIYRYKGNDYTFYEYKKGVRFSMGISYKI